MHSNDFLRSHPSVRVAIAFFLAFLCLAHGQDSVQATVFYADAVGGSDAQAGTSWATAKKSIQAAMVAAASGDQVWVAEGVYREAIGMLSGVSVYGGFSIGETSFANRNVRAHKAVIDGSTAVSGGPADHVVLFFEIESSLLDGFTITGGLANDASPINQFGGGVWFATLDSTNSLRNCTVVANEAVGPGGGIAIFSGASPNIQDCTVIGNVGLYGGGIYIDGTPSDTAPELGSSSPLLERVTISGNRATLGAGLGAILNAHPNLINCVLSGNRASGTGGAIYFASVSPPLINSTLVANQASSAGGVYLENNSSASLTQCILTSNDPYEIFEGGPFSDPTLEYCLFNNSIGSGTDYYDDDLGQGLIGAAVLNASLAQASDNLSGNPLFLGGSTGAWTAVPAYDSATRITTVTDSAALLSPGILAGKLIQPSTSQLLQAYILDNTTTTIQIAGDVTADATVGHSYRVIDYRLQLGSAAIDAGTSASGSAPDSDYDGIPRPLDVLHQGADGNGAEYDIGAHEALVVDVSVEKSCTPPLVLVGGTLVYTVTATNIGLATATQVFLADTLPAGVLFVSSSHPCTASGSVLSCTLGSLAGNQILAVTYAVSVLQSGTLTNLVEISTSIVDLATANNSAIAEAFASNPSPTPTVTPSATLTETPTPTSTPTPTATHVPATLYVDAVNGSDLQTGTSWATAKRSLGSALIASSSGDQIWVAEGHYLEAIAMKDGVTLYGGFQNGASNLSDRDIRAQTTLIDAATAESGGPANHVVTFSGTSGAGLDGFTITGGRADGPSVQQTGGGGIWFFSADDSNRVANCNIVDNTAAFGGGMVFILHSSPLILDSTIAGNVASATGLGGGVYLDGVLGGVAPRFERLVIAGNRAVCGGGIAMIREATPVIVNCLLVGNGAALEGGGLSLSNCRPSLVNCTLSDNSAGVGGGLFAKESGRPSLTNTLFSMNAPYEVYEHDALSDPELAYCLFDNTVGSGTDYYDFDTASDIHGATLINTLSPGSFHNLSGDPFFQPGGGGTWTSGPIYDATSHSTLLSDAGLVSPPGSLAGKLIGPSTDSSLAAFILDNTSDEIQLSGDWTGLAFQGGDYRFLNDRTQYGSAAIDSGTGEGAFIPADDLDGNSRPTDLPGLGADNTGTEFDIGAYESSAMAPTPTPTSSETPTLSPTSTFTETPTITLTPTSTITETPTNTQTPTSTVTSTPTPTLSPVPPLTNTPTSTITETPTITLTPTSTITETPTITLTPTSTITQTPTITLTPTSTITQTPTITLTPTSTITQTPTITLTPTSTITQTPTITLTPTSTITQTPTITLTPTSTITQTPTITLTPTSTITQTPTITLTPTSTITQTPTITLTPTSTVTQTPTITLTPTSTITQTPTITLTPTSTVTQTPTNTLTPTSTITQTPTITLTPTSTVTQTPTITLTPTSTVTQTPTITLTPTSTITQTPTITLTPTSTITQTPTITLTPTSTVTETPTSTALPEALDEEGLLQILFELKTGKLDLESFLMRIRFWKFSPSE